MKQLVSSRGLLACKWIIGLIVAGVVAFQVSKLFPHSKPNPPDTVQSATNDIPTESIRVGSEVSIDRTESDNLDRTRSLSAIWEKSKHAIFLLETFDSAGEQIGLGTAFSISGNGKLVTNLHVIKNAESVTAKTTNGERFKVESVLAFSKDNDLAILKIEAQELSYLDIDFNLPDVGADILVLGSPLGLEGSLSNGVVAAIRKDNESVPSDLIQITAPISPGSSGSPVMNRNGLVVGVATLASTKGAQNLNFAVPSAKISDLQNHLLKTSISISELRILLEDDAEIRDSRLWEDFRTAVDAKDSDLARDLAEKLVKKYPDNPIPRIALGEIFLGMALDDEAIEQLREAVDLDEKSVKALTSLGIALHARFRTTEAIKYLEKAVVIQPDYEKALLGLAEAYLQAGNVTAALAVARRAAEFNPLNQLLATRISEMLESSEENQPSFTLPNAEVPPVKIPEPKLYPWKTHVECKVFWVGSPPSKSYPRGTSESAWNKKWVADFGGTDFPSPDSRIADHQTGEFRPKAFTPKENPFYISLPYDDLAQLEGYRPEAHKVIPWFNPNISGQRKSFCKGAWLQIFHNGRSCYAQWEAVGPNFSDDWEYVFGKKPPKSHAAGGSGLGISPAIRDYLQITDDKKVHWRFVESRNVPLGSWKTFGRANTGDLPTTETEGIEAQRKYLEYLRKLRDEQFRK